MTTRDVVLAHIEAFNRHDTGGLLDRFGPDAVWVTGTDRFRGHAELAALFDDGLWEMQPRLELRSLLTDGPRAAAQLRETITVDGQQRTFDIAVFVETDAGVITAAQVYREGSADLYPA